MSSILQPGGLPAGSEPARIIAPDPGSLFADRARRFSVLAQGHALGDWLRFLCRLTQAQHAALQALPAVTLPDAAALARAREHGMPPVPAQEIPGSSVWRGVLLQIVAAIEADAPDAVRKSTRRLGALTEPELAALAAQVLGNELHGKNAALLPFVGAALQVHWTALAAALGAPASAALDVPNICPCCGSLPVASIVRIAPDVNNLRYLHCSLCNTEWNYVRIKCSVCEESAQVGYRQLDGAATPDAAAMRGETCEACKSYLKILYQEKAPTGDPVADDLATLALDILLDEAGYARAGPNLLFVAETG